MSGLADSRHRHALIQIHILHGVEELDAFFHGFLEGFAAGDEADAAGSFVDDGGADGVLEVGGAFGFAAGVEQGASAGEAVEDLVAAEVDGIGVGTVFFGGLEFGVDALVEFAVGG